VRFAARVVLFVVLWLLAWGDITVGNVVSGAAVATVLLIAFPPSRRAGRGFRISIVGSARLAVYVAVQLLSSNVVMVREILRPRPAVRPGVLTHRLVEPSEEIVTVMTSVIALSPGTMTVDVDRASTTICVHFLFLHDVAAARAFLVRLETMTRRAIAVASPEPTPLEEETQ
jgi:multicomponent Na+:H+ antiporter subunit E